MAQWKKGQDVYERLTHNIGEWLSSCADEGVLEVNRTPNKVVDLAKTIIPDFVSGLKVADVIDIHEYLMYMSTLRPDPRFPTYVYSGGDRIISVTRFLLKNIDLELAKQYA